MALPVPAVCVHSDEHPEEILDNLASFPFSRDFERPEQRVLYQCMIAVH